MTYLSKPRVLSRALGVKSPCGPSLYFVFLLDALAAACYVQQVGLGIAMGQGTGHCSREDALT